MARQKPSGEDAYFNSIQEARYVEPEEEGYVFEFGDGEFAFVRAEEFDEEGPPEGFDAELLVQRPYGNYWAASMQMAEKLAIWDSIVEHFEEGRTVEGDIIRENKGGLSVDIGLRAFLPRSQVDIHRVDDCSPYVGRRETFKIIEFKEERCEVILSRREILERQRDEQRAKTIEKLEPDAVFEGTVRNIVDYGAFVDIGGIEGLLHVSNMSWGRIDHPSELLRPGDELRVVVLEYDESRDRLSLGRKQLMDDPWESVEEKFSSGDVVDGTVVSLADFGAFVEVAPGLEGLVHVTELAWLGRINHPREVLNLEQDVQVKIINIDLEKKRLELSIKRLEPNPWELLAEKVAPGDRVSGPIRNIEDFGLFVEIFPGIEGLVHVSDLSWTEAIDDPAEHYDVGDEIEVVVLDIDTESQRAGLGIKQLEDDPWERAAEIATPGKKIEGEVTRIEDYGAFVEVVEGVEGLIHISELRDERVERVADVVKPGKTVEPLVLSFDRGNRRIGLSLKRESLDEEKMRSYEDTEGATSTLGDILRDSLGIGEEEESEEMEEVEEVESSEEPEEAEEIESAEEPVEDAVESAESTAEVESAEEGESAEEESSEVEEIDEEEEASEVEDVEEEASSGEESSDEEEESSEVVDEEDVDQPDDEDAVEESAAITEEEE